MENNEDEYINTVSKLKFISKIEPGEKIDTQSLTIVSYSLATRFYRCLFSRGESRETTFKFINEIVTKAFNLLYHYTSSDIDNENSTRINEIITSLEKSITGLKNLVETYYTDRMYTSRIDTLINSIVSKTAYVKGKL